MVKNVAVARELTIRCAARHADRAEASNNLPDHKLLVATGSQGEPTGAGPHTPASTAS
jgi:hypothetical protein